MEQSRKIQQILEFVSHYPESTASRTVIRRILKKGYQEFSSELTVQLEEELGKTDHELVNLCYDLVK